MEGYGAEIGVMTHDSNSATRQLDDLMQVNNLSFSIS